MIGNEAVGKQLRQGAGLTEKPADQCNHPEQRMYRRGNRHGIWWHCNLCLSRWERFQPASHVQDMPKDDDTVSFGKHQGKTHKQVYEEAPQYCHWACQTAEEDFDNADMRLIALANYTRKRQMNEAEGPQFPDNSDMDEDYDLEEKL